MLTFLVLAIWLVSWGDTGQAGQDLELGGGPIVETEEFGEKIKEKVKLEEFKNVPKLKEGAAAKPALSWSHSAVAIDAESGKVLFGKEERKKMPLASLTKVMTAIILDEKIDDWKEGVKISKGAAFSGGAAIHLKWDETVRAKDLYKAMLMNSDNAAAIALAEHVAGSTDKFVELMNKKAKKIGALDTKFLDPSGLEDEQSFSTAYDMAKITQYAIGRKEIVKVLQTKGPIEIASLDGTLTHRVGNTNLFLKDERLAPRVVGAKTGFTYKAGYCLMSAMYDSKKKKKVIGVILNSGKDMRWEEMEEVIEWSFKNYQW